MTEKEKTLELVIKFFMDKAEEMSKSKNQMVMVSANQGHWAAIEIAGLGAHVSTIDWAVREYLKKYKSWFRGNNNLQLAIAMTLKGASNEVAEEVLAVVVKYRSSIWMVEQLTEYLCRKPTEEEVFSMVEAERVNTATLSEDTHKTLIKFANKYLPPDKVRKVKNILEGKTREFNSHSD